MLRNDPPPPPSAPLQKKRRKKGRVSRERGWVSPPNDLQINHWTRGAGPPSAQENDDGPGHFVQSSATHRERAAQAAFIVFSFLKRVLNSKLFHHRSLISLAPTLACCRRSWSSWNFGAPLFPISADSC